ncbi:hypothetical protein CcaverHIS631_0701060 [Cutaneotrichosporon cavernicola]|nr:hypothetical protein CcaverHIS631_0701060 [Cutaneotrichosporon cavernicola]BEJ10070.1 hypothetical protein CcaverHIS641_0701050 [Cutaneotrichosporon cavernicola]
MTPVHNTRSSRTRSSTDAAATHVDHAKAKARLNQRRAPKPKMLPNRKVLDSTAFPHVFERIIDLAPFEVLLTLRFVSRATRTRVDKLLWRHVAMGTPGNWDCCDLTEPFPPYNSLPREEREGPMFGDPVLDENWVPDTVPAGIPINRINWEKETERRRRVRLDWGVRNDIRVVDNFGGNENTAFDFPDAVVRYIWPTFDIGTAKSFVYYIRLPQTLISHLHFHMPSSLLAERVIFRSLVDIPVIEERLFSWVPLCMNHRPRDALNLKMKSLAYVFEVFKDGPGRKVEEEKLAGAIKGLDVAVGAVLSLGLKVTIAGLERIPLHALGFAPTTSHESVCDVIRSAVAESARKHLAIYADDDPILIPTFDEAMTGFTICTFEEWAATADPAEVAKPDIDPNFLGNPTYVESHVAPQLPFNPMGPRDNGVYGHDPSDSDFSDNDMAFDGGFLDDDDFDEVWEDDEDEDGFPGVINIIGS